MNNLVYTKPLFGFVMRLGTTQGAKVGHEIKKLGMIFSTNSSSVAKTGCNASWSPNQQHFTSAAQRVLGD